MHIRSLSFVIIFALETTIIESIRILSDIKSFVFGGMRTLRSAAKGNYGGESEEVKAIRQEMFSRPSGRMSDVINMRHDRMMIGRDMRTSF